MQIILVQHWPHRWLNRSRFIIDALIWFQRNCSIPGNCLLLIIWTTSAFVSRVIPLLVAVPTYKKNWQVYLDTQITFSTQRKCLLLPSSVVQPLRTWWTTEQIDYKIVLSKFKCYACCWYDSMYKLVGTLCRHIKYCVSVYMMHDIGNGTSLRNECIQK